MREILFRAKRTDNGEWIEGSLVHRTKFYGDPDDTYFIIHDGEFACDYYEAEKVDPSTVCQYTGATDKNGKRIFEGDILRFFNGEDYSLYSISLESHSWVVKMVTDTFAYADILDAFFCERSEAVGNVYDNPELKEAENE